ncbi:MAG: hypothetical protein MJK08_06595 [Campylobacterales bacterium]|nr:hypothetical protein [Campylobacterales bacterium]
MTLYGITMDFDDIKTCGLLPDLCVDWDHRSEELSENEAFDLYWNKNTQELLSKTQKLVLGNDGNKSLVYSADEEAISFIKEIFKEMTLNSLEYEDINQCERCITLDYLKLV